MIKTEKVYDRIFVEFCQDGKPAILHVEKDGVVERIKTSVVEKHSSNCTGAVTITTARTIYKSY